ncbi:hypothetical protein [Paracoccus marcusii]|uniref:hypothetical protein n=1 Tax=Paracoccus marcusii TaxID=59779 RepID=UPI0037369981
MKHFLHNSTILKALSFLMIDAPFGSSYNWRYPLGISILTCLFAYLVGGDVNYWGQDGLVMKLAPLLSVLFPFYVAALAAVATFKGVADLDQYFPPDISGRRVTMPRMGSGGHIEYIQITQRHYLSLLFGYCAVVSIGLIFFSIIFSFSANSVSLPENNGLHILSYAILFAFTFLFLQIILLTLVAVYYLSDRLHVSKKEAGNDAIDEALKESKREIKKDRD